MTSTESTEVTSASMTIASSLICLKTMPKGLWCGCLLCLHILSSQNPFSAPCNSLSAAAFPVFERSRICGFTQTGSQPKKWLTWRHRGQCWGFKVEFNLVLQSIEYFKRIADDEASCKRSQVITIFFGTNRFAKGMNQWLIELFSCSHLCTDCTFLNISRWAGGRMQTGEYADALIACMASFFCSSPV